MVSNPNIHSRQEFNINAESVPQVNLEKQKTPNYKLRRKVGITALAVISLATGAALARNAENISNFKDTKIDQVSDLLSKQTLDPNINEARDILDNQLQSGLVNYNVDISGWDMAYEDGAELTLNKGYSIRAIDKNYAGTPAVEGVQSHSSLFIAKEDISTRVEGAIYENKDYYAMNIENFEEINGKKTGLRTDIDEDGIVFLDKSEGHLSELKDSEE